MEYFVSSNRLNETIVTIWFTKLKLKQEGKTVGMKGGNWNYEFVDQLYRPVAWKLENAFQPYNIGLKMRANDSFILLILGRFFHLYRTTSSLLY